jgi:hypothetical protein
MFSNIFGGKDFYKSLTAWGVILIAGVQAGEATGVVPIGTAAAATGSAGAVVKLVEALGGLLIVLGIRKAATAPNTDRE